VLLACVALSSSLANGGGKGTETEIYCSPGGGGGGDGDGGASAVTAAAGRARTSIKGFFFSLRQPHSRLPGRLRPLCSMTLSETIGRKVDFSSKWHELAPLRDCWILVGEFLLCSFCVIAGFVDLLG